jgi:hypothetical protein
MRQRRNLAMAKVPFSKLQAKVNNDVVKVTHLNNAGEEIVYEVRKYLPLNEKLELVSRIINQSMDDNGFYNPMRVKFNMVVETVFVYTNLSFTEKMKEDLFKLYDVFMSSGLFNNVVGVISSEWTEIQEDVWSTINNIYNYNNSVMGILDTLKTDYDNLNFDATEIQKKISDPENMALLREILTKLG